MLATESLPEGKAAWADMPEQNSKQLAQIDFNLFNRIHFKLILLTLLVKSFKTNLNCSYVLLLDVCYFNHYAMELL